MEGVILDSGALTFAAAFGTLIVLVLAAAGIMLGYISDRERSGETIYWSAEPLPGTGGPEGGVETEVRRAA